MRIASAALPRVPEPNGGGCSWPRCRKARRESSNDADAHDLTRQWEEAWRNYVQDTAATGVLQMIPETPVANPPGPQTPPLQRVEQAEVVGPRTPPAPTTAAQPVDATPMDIDAWASAFGLWVYNLADVIGPEPDADAEAHASSANAPAPPPAPRDEAISRRRTYHEAFGELG